MAANRQKMKLARILIVDDEPNIRQGFASLLEDEGYTATTVESAEEAETFLERRPFDLILLDLRLPGRQGLELLGDWSGRPSAPKVLVISGQADIADALDAVRLGALDFLEKPVSPEKLLASVSAALSLVAAERQRSILVDEIDQRCRIVGDSRPIRDLLKQIDQVAPTDATVLIDGENGTGKDLIATRIYLQSRRREAPFIRVNCPGIPDTLFESELFGHTRGAFTGAVGDRAGKFVLADGGTLFLDEIGELPTASQAKLLRVLETGEVETLGSSETRRVDVRILGATNRDLKRMIADGKFREDLYYRLSVVTLTAPPLGDRRDDIPLLVGEFLRQFDPSGRIQFAPAAIAYLAARDYRGNVRELRNLVERVTILLPDGVVDQPALASLTERRRVSTEETAEAEPLAGQVARFEKELIRATLAVCDGNISEAARRLQTDRAGLSRKIKEYGLKTSER